MNFSKRIVVQLWTVEETHFSSNNNFRHHPLGDLGDTPANFLQLGKLSRHKSHASDF